MRALAIGLTCLAVAACSKAPDGSEPGGWSTGASGVAFTYAYTFRLPSSRIAAAQEAHAAACERLGAARCRITGMSFRVDDTGAANASLQVTLAAPVARAFGRQQVAVIEQAGGALADAEIGGVEAAPATRKAVADRSDAAAERARTERALARADLPPAERAALVERQGAAGQAARDANAAREAAATSVAFTPMSFAYRAGSGVGLAARIGDAGQLAATSLAFTMSATLTTLAVLGPPAVLLVVLLLLWRGLGRTWWRRLTGAGETV